MSSPTADRGPERRQRAIRDRDQQGRPLNARPRDALGRPLPRGATGAEPATAQGSLAPSQALLLAQHLLDEDRPFHAHEVLEAAWKSAPAQERDLWRGLAQIAVGITHARRGNSRGAVALLRRGSERVGSYGASAPHGIDAHAVARRAVDLADAIGQPGATGPGSGPISFQLTSGGPA